MKSFRFVVVAMLAWLPFFLSAQVDSAFEESRRALMKEFEEFKQQNQQEFDQYVEEIDKEFSDYLKQAWEEFRLFAGEIPDTTPKPKIIPKFDPIQGMGKPREVLVETPTVTPGLIIPQFPNIPMVKKTEPGETGEKEIEIEFYGVPLTIRFDEEMELSFPESFTNQEIGEYWENVSNMNYTLLLNQLQSVRDGMNLNDWGYYLLVSQAASKISESTNSSRLLSWFLMTKSGYKFRVAYNGGQIYLLFPAANTIYGIKYFIFDKVRYYAPDFPGEKILTYETDFPDATRIMDLNVYKALNIGNETAERAFHLPYNNRTYDFNISYNLNAVEFFKDFPLCELKVYFDAAVTPSTKESILNTLRPLLEQRSETDAVNFLLNFVQNGFPYKTDQDQFNGMEKFFFPEENFYYPYSDCDDRAIFFSYLVRELLGLKVIAVAYPGHIATAVHFNSDVPGDYVIWHDEKYTIADPTFINAPAGLTMSGMVNEKAELIPLINEQYIAKKATSVWELAEAGGGFPGESSQNMAVDPLGNSYITGYFTGSATFGKTTFKGFSDKNDVFVARYDARGNPAWALQGGGNGMDLAGNVAFDKEGNLIAAGNFYKRFTLGTRSLKAPGTDLFIAKISPSGEVLWLKQADIDSTSATGAYIFVASLTPEGWTIKTRFFPPDEHFDHFGLSFDNDGNIYYTAASAASTGLRVDLLSMNLAAGFDMVSTLKTETDKELEARCEKSIAGLFAAIKLVRLNSVALSGKTAQEAFHQYNPGFINTAPTVYKCIGQVEIIRNNEGIITIATADKKPVVIDRLKLYHDARFKVTMLPNGDARIEVLGGVKVGKAFIWFPLNYVRLFRTNGNVLFDFDSDHSQVTMNVKKDLLF